MVGQVPIPATPSGTTLAGKTIIITGGNTGLGYESARQYLNLNAARVIITARSETKGKEAVAALQADPEVKAANPSAKIEFFLLELDDYKSGLQFVKRVKKEVPELDLLLCNGGISLMHYQASASGHERVMQVNCYTHFLIILELLPLLRSTAKKCGTPSRITFVGSNMQIRHGLTKNPILPTETVIGHFDDRQKYDGLARYMDSKLLVNAFIRHLASVISADEIVVNNVCPGMVATGLDRTLPRWIRGIMFFVRKVMARSVEEGTRTLIYASAVMGAETHGKFVQNNLVDVGAPFLNETAGKELMSKLWDDVLNDVKVVDPSFSL